MSSLREQLLAAIDAQFEINDKAMKSDRAFRKAKAALMKAEHEQLKNELAWREAIQEIERIKELILKGAIA